MGGSVEPDRPGVPRGVAPARGRGRRTARLEPRRADRADRALRSDRPDRRAARRRHDPRSRDPRRHRRRGTPVAAGRRRGRGERSTVPGRRRARRAARRAVPRRDLAPPLHDPRSGRGDQLGAGMRRQQPPDGPRRPRPAARGVADGGLGVVRGRRERRPRPGHQRAGAPRATHAHDAAPATSDRGCDERPHQRRAHRRRRAGVRLRPFGRRRARHRGPQGVGDRA